MQWLFAEVMPFPPSPPFCIKALVCFPTSSSADFFLTSIALPYLSLWLLCVPGCKQGGEGAHLAEVQWLILTHELFAHPLLPFQAGLQGESSPAALA